MCVFPLHDLLRLHSLVMYPLNTYIIPFWLGYLAVKMSKLGRALISLSDISNPNKFFHSSLLDINYGECRAVLLVLDFSRFFKFLLSFFGVETPIIMSHFGPQRLSRTMARILIMTDPLVKTFYNVCGLACILGLTSRRVHQ